MQNIFLGLMSGTSCDGLDIVLCNFSYNDSKYGFEILASSKFDYSDDFRKRLLNAIYFSAEELIILETDFSIFCANMVNKFLDNLKIKPNYISSHGHTIFHNPSYWYSLQIGNGEIIAKRTGIDCIYDFRSGDIALGGQGAPLVPIGDQLLFSEFHACLNIGGIANISVNVKNKRIAYDICPANMVLNFLSSKLNKKYDEDGILAQNGKLVSQLLDELNNLQYYKLKYPKSIGKEWVINNIICIFDKYNEYKIEDLLHTYTIHVAKQIAENINSSKNVLITGGGAYNKFLINSIKQFTNAEIIIPNNEIVDFKEALIFAFMGYLRVNNKINCLASVTGASRDSCCGSIAKA